MKIGFSGHETFVCRSFWLKKGYDFLKEGHSFSQEDAVVRLGVGKNMVTAINFWLRGFFVYDKDQNGVTDLGDYLFKGKDPFLEDIASLWLLHYSVIKHQKVFLFNAFFNEFTKERNEFTRDHLIGFMKRKTGEDEIRLFSEKTYEADAMVFLRTYVRSNDGRADLEDETASLLVDLNLIRTFSKENTVGKQVQWFRVLRQERNDIPREVLLFTILDRFGNEPQSIGFNELLEAPESPGAIFSFSEKGLEIKLKELENHYKGDVSFSETAGNQVLQLRNSMNKWEILDEYYG